MKISRIYRKILQSYTYDNILYLHKNIIWLYIYTYIYIHTHIYIYIFIYIFFFIYYKILIFYSFLKSILHYSTNSVICLSILTCDTDFHNLTEKNFTFIDKIVSTTYVFVNQSQILNWKCIFVAIQM